MFYACGGLLTAREHAHSHGHNHGHGHGHSHSDQSSSSVTAAAGADSPGPAQFLELAGSDAASGAGAHSEAPAGGGGGRGKSKPASAVPGGPDPVDPSRAFKLHSRPGAAKKIVLNFKGVCMCVCCVLCVFFRPLTLSTPHVRSSCTRGRAWRKRSSSTSKVGWRDRVSPVGGSCQVC